MYPWLAIALTFIASFAQSSFGGIGDTIVVNFRQNAETNFVPGNPPGFQDIPMVSLCGDAHYHNPWEVMTAWDPGNTGNEVADFSGTGTVLYDRVPSLPAGEYHVYLSFNIANWDGSSPVGFQLAGPGVVELGNEMPGEMHFFYPQANIGQDTKNMVEVAGTHMGPGSAFLVFEDGAPVTLNPPGGTGICAPHCPPIPTGSDPDGLNDGNSFATSVLLAPGNRFRLSIHDGSAVGDAHIRGYAMTFDKVAPYFPPPLEACCFDDGSCMEIDPNVCVVSNGVPLGVGTDCATATCLQPGAKITDVKAGSAGAVFFESQPGHTYALQYTTDLVTTTGWVYAGVTYAATVTNSYLFDPAEPTGSDFSSKRYRVIASTGTEVPAGNEPGSEPVDVEVRVESAETIYTDGQWNGRPSIAFWRGEYHVAFRSSFGHASAAGQIGKAMMLKSADLLQWTASTFIDQPDIDVGEVQLLATDNRLFMYIVAEYPITTSFMTWSDDGLAWAAPIPVYSEGYSFSLPVEHNGVYYTAADNGVVELLASTNGFDWTRVSDIVASGTETALVFFEDDSLLAVTRQSQISLADPPYTQWDHYSYAPVALGGPAAVLAGDTVLVGGRHSVQTSLLQLHMDPTTLEFLMHMPMYLWGVSGDKSYPEFHVLDDERVLMVYYDGDAYEPGIPKRSDIRMATLRIFPADCEF